MACVNLQTIYDTECIGASLPKINGNFAALSAAVCNLSSIPLEVLDTATIDLTLDGRTLYADAKTIPVQKGGTGISTVPSNGSLLIGNGSGYTVATLSAGSGIAIDNKSGAVGIGLQTGASQFAKAWVSFDGTISTPTIHSSFNISSVQKVAYGYYDITFSTPMQSLNYLVVGGCGATPSSSGGPSSSECNVYVIDSNHYTNPFARTTSTFRIMTKGEAGTLNESYRTDVIIFAN